MKAVIIDPSGCVVGGGLMRGGVLPALCAAIGCAMVEALKLDDGTLAVWADENGIAAGLPVNWPASLLAQELLGVPVWLRGTVVMTGFDPEQGATVGLTGVQEGDLRRRLGAFARAAARWARFRCACRPQPLCRGRGSGQSSQTSTASPASAAERRKIARRS
jgi:hypothetical protein